MSRFALVVGGAPYGTQDALSAWRFARAAIEAGHQVVRVFFYQDGVYNGSMLQAPESDDFDLYNAWCELATEHETELCVCVAAALRRGVTDQHEAQTQQLKQFNLEPPFVLTGLGQLAEAALIADRVIQF